MIGFTPENAGNTHCFSTCYRNITSIKTKLAVISISRLYKYMHRSLKSSIIVTILIGVTISILGMMFILQSAFASSGQSTRIGHTTISNVIINGKRGKFSVGAGKRLNVKLDFVSDSSARCPKCQNQIIVAFAKEKGRRLERIAGGRCIYSNDGKTRKRGFKFKINAPKKPGQYRLIAMATQAYNCRRALQYQPRHRPIAALRVR
jgi:ribosomal protein S27AE